MLVGNRRIDALDPKFQPIAREWQIIADIAIPRRWPGWKAVISDTLRDAVQQAQLQAAQKSDAKFGWHNVGLAFDFSIFDASGKYIEDGMHPAYMAGITIGQLLGCHCPIVMANGHEDRDHIEWHPGFTLQQLIAARAAGKVLFA